MRALVIPWTAAEVERRYRAAATPLAARRYQALWLRAQGIGMREAAATVGVTTETLRAWIKRGAAAGLDELAGRKPGSGGRGKLTAAQQEQVLAWAAAAPRVTMPTLRARSRGCWGIALSEPQVWALVRGRGFRRVVPRKRHDQADPAALAVAEKN